MILKLIDFLHETFGIDKNTAATILVTLFTFSLGILITVIFKTVEGILDRYNHRKLLRLNLISLMKEMFRQATAYNRFAEQLSIELFSTPVFRKVSISAIGIFYQLGYKNLYCAFFNGIENFRFGKNNSKRIAFNNIWSTLEYLTLSHQNSFKDFEVFMNREKEANELRNKCILEAYEIVNKIRFKFHKADIPPNLSAYCNGIEGILLNLQKQDDFTNPKTVNEYFVHPLLELNNKDLDLLHEYSDELNTASLNSILWECLI